MIDPFRPGRLLVLPSGRRVIVQRIWRDDVLCRYEKARPCDGRLSVKKTDHDLQLSRRFCARYARALPLADVPGVWA